MIPPGGPIEGTDADAVLSRAEFALKAGDIEKAIVEMKGLSGLPAEVSQDWIAAAESRLAVEQTAKVVKAHVSLAWMWAYVASLVLVWVLLVMATVIGVGLGNGSVNVEANVLSIGANVGVGVPGVVNPSVALPVWAANAGVSTDSNSYTTKTTSATNNNVVVNPTTVTNGNGATDCICVCESLGERDVGKCHTRLANEATLVIIKGDLNYRRLLGDRLWPPSTPVEEAIPYFPTTFVSFRTMKSDPVVGIPADIVTKLEKEDPKWRYNGKRGTIQSVLPSTSASKKPTNVGID
ncbi:hypothetical protein PHMEG_00032950 [Phytophthora megakarya]|uniref:Sugar phosphate phosphatase n=1 Tax=Phytophthora megakarya TaxID=4795 RepID=A0A225UU63_9STRA|nr:hypothetical protein PHMEG_00032950 [Phytophthora megakarya]